MPVDLWLECICDSTEFGEEVAVVGNHPVLGDWRPENAVALTTSPASFPRWTLERPLRIEKDATMLSACVEYKYIVRKPGDSQCRWEDLGARELPSFTSTSSTITNLRIELLLQGGFAPRPLNRRLPGCQALRVRGSPGVSLRVDVFGSYAPVLEASWSVPDNWEPELAGCAGAIGPDCFRLTRDVQLATASAPVADALRRAVGGALSEDDKPLVFLAPRSRLLGGLSQLRRRHALPMGLWDHIWDLLGGLETDWPKLCGGGQDEPPDACAA